ncbi:MAG: hypothetical protein RLY66_687 [Candidatus Parcubacteria bacterium]|jgi:prepilin-type N-terminal cleavage/methylation domain-containing protein
MKRAFTLVELLVVISIVSMLASIVMVQISLAQAKGRDSARVQQVRQIDLATQLYVEDFKKAPLALTGCDILVGALPTEAEASACFAVSTASVGPQKDAWDAFKEALNPYMKVPNDPCGGTCQPGNENFPIGYTYVAPLALQYYCDTIETCTVTDESYQIYAPMERETVPAGNEGSTDEYAINPAGGSDGGGEDTTPPSVPTGVQVALNPLWTGGSMGIHITWNASTDDDSGIAGYKISELDDNSYSGSDGDGNPIPIAPIPGTSRDTFGAGWSVGLSFCYSVRAYDVAGNVSELSDPVCTPNIPAPFAAPTGVTVVRQGNQATVSWNAAANLTSDAIVKYQIYHPGGSFIGETTPDQTSTSYYAAGWGNCVRVAPIGYLVFDDFESPVYNDNGGYGVPSIASATTCAGI